MTRDDRCDGPFGFADFQTRLTRLIETCLVQRDGRLVALDDGRLAKHITEASGEKITRPYVYALRTGEQTNPSATKLAAIAAAFDVSPLYFFSEAVYDRTNERLDLELERKQNELLFGPDTTDEEGADD